MATTDEILAAARDVGKLVRDHKAITDLQAAAKQLRDDTDAQRALADFERAVQAVAQKESQGQPVEVEEKRKLESLQQKVVSNATLRAFQMAQMEMLDLRRRIDEAIFAVEMPPEAQQAAAAESPLVNPDLTGG